MAKSLAVWIGNVDNVNPSANSSDNLVEKPEGIDQPENGLESDAEIELHFNYWSFGGVGKKNSVNYLDVGVFYRNTNNDINLFFPFNLEKEDVDCSLGKIVCHDIDILSAIFNSSVLKLEYPDTNPFAQVKTKNNKGKEDLFNFYYNFDIGELASNVKLRKSNNGCIVTFPHNVFKSTEKCYLRFRIYLNDLSKRAISQSYISKDRFLLTKSEEIEIIDFRINELRNMPSSISPLLSHNSPLKTVHFFVIREASVESRMADSTFQRCRLLEDQPWGKYLAADTTSTRKSRFKSESPPQMLIYHWKSESKKGGNSQDTQGANGSDQLLNFSALAKFSHVKTSWFQIVIYAIVIVFLGVLSSLIASWLLEYFTTESAPNYNSDFYLNCVLAEHERTISEFKQLDGLTSIDKSFTSKDIYHMITPQNICSALRMSHDAGDKNV